MITTAREHNIVATLPPHYRCSALGWWCSIIRNWVKLIVVHVNVDLSEAGGVTISCVRERSKARHRFLFITDYHAVLCKVSRNPENLIIHFDLPSLVHRKSYSLSLT
jgi:hypothetical protein